MILLLYSSYHREAFVNFFSEEFSLKDLDVSARVLENWYKKGLLPYEKLTFKFHRFDFSSYIWMNIVTELRKVGLPIQKIQKVKTYLLQELSFQQVFSSFSLESFTEEIKKLGVLGQEEQDKLINQYKSGQQLCHDIEKIPFTLLSLVVIKSLMQKKSVILMINSETDSVFFSDILLNKKTEEKLFEDTHIMIPLNKFFTRFISTTKNLNFLAKTQILNEKELFILSQIKDGKADSIIIRFKKRKPVMLEVVKEKKIKSEAKLSEILLKGKYQELEVKTQEGHITYTNVKTKILL